MDGSDDTERDGEIEGVLKLRNLANPLQITSQDFSSRTLAFAST